MPPKLDVPKAKAELPPEVARRSKPEASMVACGELSGLPPTLTARSGKEQAEYLLNAWSDAVEAYAACSIKQAALTEWIRQD